MPGNRTRILLTFLSMIIVTSIWAQPCTYYPADCPGEMPSKDQTFCDHHFILSEEIKMQDKIRDFVAEQMEEIAAAKKWEYYELDEYADGPFLLPIDHNKEAYPVPFPLRAPHEFQISFVFIVNADSINVWKDWYNDMGENGQKDANDMKSSFEDPAYIAAEKEDMDSADYWGGQLVGYQTKNIQAYQQAAINRDDTFMKKYETISKNYQSHSDYWTKKASDRAQALMAPADQKIKQSQNDSHLKIDAFRDATMIRVTFDFNAYKAIAAESDDIHLAKQLSEPSTTLAQLYHNSNTNGERVYHFNVFTSSTDLALLLFGKWNIGPDKYRQYHPVYTMDKKNTDKVSVKTIPCDKLQTISIYVEGRPDYIESFVKVLDAEKLNAMIIK